MTSGISRRATLAGMVAAACPGRAHADFLGHAPGMFAAGVIARDMRGRVVLQEADGGVFGSRARFGVEAAFRVASVSKMIATFAFMPLVRAGRIGLDDDVGAIVGDDLRHPAHRDVAITPRLLLAHLSGLRNGADYPVGFGRRLADRLRAARDEADYGEWYAPDGERPGRYFAYADVNYALVAGLMESATGVRFDRYMREKVFAPHGLDIGFNWSGVSQRKRDRAAAAVRNFDGVWTAQIDDAIPQAPDPLVPRAPEAASTSVDAYRLGDNGFVFGPQGGLRLSLADMDRLVRILRRDSEDMAGLQWVHDGTNGNTESGFYAAYGLAMQRPGFGALDGFFGAESRDWRGHCGDAYGWMTGMFWNARDGRSIVYAVNGMQEFQRPRAERTALTPPEQALIDLALDRMN
ncbi:MAG: serine hydrolase [Hyphomonadaceae bacterium]|nr:serine hydrolase [Hyphomonadaceae bacterium]